MWLLEASTFAKDIDNTFLFIVAVSAFFLIAITVFMISCIFLYSKKRNATPTDVHGNTTLEIVWIIIPVVLTSFMFYYGWIDYIKTRQVPDNAMEIKVDAGMWWWKFTYPNGLEQGSDQGLTVPVNSPIYLPLHSVDVVHSFSIPAFRIKMDVMPKPEGAKLNYSWFEATKVGDFDIYCAEYCGINHAQMITKVHVLPKAEFEKWYQQATNDLSSANTDGGKSNGKKLFALKGCIGCHSTDGTKRVGPSLKGLSIGSNRKVVTAGKLRTIQIDQSYLEQSLTKPNIDLVEGFTPIMPPQQLTDQERQALIDYLLSL
ncbi:MAG: cytochrome c oxidase subunit II [Bdellovibrionales bacterium]|jgi:cytochrome c oxidase subunit II|nr:cytochrome c oxidase subunit II [Bdellovibrionales bacterium]MBT3527007.1 cytochrome c oxidase subunit II [Bdellovibrionales bacterium]MBT7669512.1 cytochrome c oxidase subunit II [Bdellovibrionales bacterium]MBT7766328.1 cytochrome c oxidase subunit II [Bdellovibrionales bacterium]